MARMLLGTVIGVVIGAILAFVVVLVTIPERIFPYSYHPLGGGDRFGCKAIAKAGVHELGTHGPDRTVNARAGRGTDTLAVRVDSAAKQLHVLSDMSVQAGRTESSAMPIIRSDDQVIVAVQIAANAEVFVLRLDKKTGNGVLGKVGERSPTEGVEGWARYLECR